MDTWEEEQQYEVYMGRWSRLVAAEFLTWLDVLGGRRWLDVGCGTGALCRLIQQSAGPRHVAGIERSDRFAEAARRAMGGSADIRVGDARSLPFEDGAFDAAVSGLVLNFLPDPLVAVREMSRVTAPGGVVAAYLWDYAGGMEMIRRFWDAAMALDESAAEMDEANRFPLCHPEPLAGLWGNAGLGDVETVAIEVPTVFDSFDDFWQPFLGGQGPAPSYVAGLDGDERVRLRERLEGAIPVSPGGAIALTARAWAVRGTV